MVSTEHMKFKERTLLDVQFKRPLKRTLGRRLRKLTKLSSSISLSYPQ